MKKFCSREWFRWMNCTRVFSHTARHTNTFNKHGQIKWLEDWAIAVVVGIAWVDAFILWLHCRLRKICTFCPILFLLLLNCTVKTILSSFSSPPFRFFFFCIYEKQSVKTIVRAILLHFHFFLISRKIQIFFFRNKIFGFLSLIPRKKSIQPF